MFFVVAPGFRFLEACFETVDVPSSFWDTTKGAEPVVLFAIHFRRMAVQNMWSSLVPLPMAWWFLDSIELKELEGVGIEDDEECDMMIYI